MHTDPMITEEHYLTPFFEPKSLAVVGASEKTNSIGYAVMRNLLEAGYRGRIFAINLHHNRVLGLPTFSSITEVPQKLDLVVMAVDDEQLMTALAECVQIGVYQVMIVGARPFFDGRENLGKRVLAYAREHHMRILGPGSLGFVRPLLDINLSYARTQAIAGSIALLSQSAAMCSTILDWARSNGVGFSIAVSLGAAIDLDFDEILDFLIYDNTTQSIFIYVEDVRQPRRFFSALRMAARIKPVLILKSKRHLASHRLAHAHNGVAVGDDEVFHAAIRRAGAVRLLSIGQLYTSMQGLYLRVKPAGNRLAIIANGAGSGVIAADRAMDLDIAIAEFSATTMKVLSDKRLHSSDHNLGLMDLGTTADVESFSDAIDVCLADDGIDGLLVMVSPQSMTDPTEIARCLCEIHNQAKKPILAGWLGGGQMSAGREMLQRSGIPVFHSPESAVELFAHIASYCRNQKLLMEMPGPLVHEEPPHLISARLIINYALNDGRLSLNGLESKALLTSFCIAVPKTLMAVDETEAVALAEEIGLPVAMKIESPDIARKEKIGGVRLNVHSTSMVRASYRDILEEVGRRAPPKARIQGVTVESMIIKPKGQEFSIQVMQDPIFGPVIILGARSHLKAVLKTPLYALPPLNESLVRDLIQSSSLMSLLHESGLNLAASMNVLIGVLLRVSEMVCELPWLKSLEISPLILDEEGAVAVDVAVALQMVPESAGPYDHMTIHPYPTNLEFSFTTSAGVEVAIRPIRPEDSCMVQNFVRALSAERRYLRFMSSLRELSPALLVRLTQIDYDREMAFVAVIAVAGQESEIGVCRYAISLDGTSCEFAVVVADDWQGCGLARKLMNALIASARQKKLRSIHGDVLARNERMLKFVTSLGFTVTAHPEDNNLKRVVLTL